ncbi:hypothetical protein Leryth_013412, partial [Lithospermum erythrorhizon]
SLEAKAFVPFLDEVPSSHFDISLGLLVASTHADSIAELYWKTVLPNAKMPNAIKSLLKSEASSNVKDPNEQEAFHLDHGYDKKRGQFSYNSYDASKSKEQATFHLDDDADNNIKRKFTYHHYGASKSNEQYDPDQSNVLEASSNVKDPNVQEAFHLDDDYDNKKRRFRYSDYGDSKSKDQATFHLDDDDYDNGHHHHRFHYEQATFHLDDDDYDNGHHHHRFHYGAPKSKEQATFHLDDDDYDNGHHHHRFHYGASKSNEQYDTSKDHLPLTYTKNKPLKKTSNITMFFLQKDLALGKKMNLDFFQESPHSSSQFFPRQKSNSIPFSSSKLPEILTRFSVNPKSREAEAINDTIQVCEEPPKER